MAHLTIRSPAGARRRVNVEGAVFRVGRAPDNDLVLDGSDIADHHAEFILADGVYSLRDLSITDPHPAGAGVRALHSGDEIHMGAFVIEFRAAASASSLAELRLPVDEITGDADGAAGALEQIGFGLLYEVGKRVLSANSFDDLNEFALSLVFECVKAERAALLLEDPGTGEFHPELLRHRDGRRLTPSEMQVPSSIVREASAERVGILTADALVDDRFKERASVRMGLVRSALCAPLWHEGEVLGVIYLDSQIQSYAFTRRDLILLSAVANLIAIRIRQEGLNTELAEQRVIRSNLERYHSPAVVEDILRRSREGESSSGLEGREVTVFFCDISGFTSLAERMSPAAVADLLNRYYALATDVIFDHGGTVNEFIGDSVMAIFGAPVRDDEHADHAVRAGLALLDALDGQIEPTVRVAINSGDVMVGNIGPKNRMKYAAVGDTVNVASRLEGLAEPGAVTLGEQTHRLLRSHYRFDDLGPINLRGHEAPIRAYRVRPRA